MAETVVDPEALPEAPSVLDFLSGKVAAPAPEEPFKPEFEAITAQEMSGFKTELRRIAVPVRRFTPLKENWIALYQPITEQLKLDMRMNLKTKKVEIKTTKNTPDVGSLQKAADFVGSFMLGFDPSDGVALLRLDDLYLDSFEIKDVKTLRGEHLSRAIGRISGKSGKTKFTIENATKTRIVLADTHIHILGSFANNKIARDAICSLILGSPPGKVYSKLRTICSRLSEKF
ncbi:pre-rRNA-processing protein pno1 [Cymbomonas tetramitiformis]|uniref:Pre-rRNA-processing protein pno1 n=1 Tax=Cymbomonas tetramitiformis TaxID=36881 RepID=A0AAE0GK55_9CHLO|nr:pre-rRNA-processing protein pno1 [Cymbomonas tetramitiformis]|eukprot:gene6232-7466_t